MKIQLAKELKQKQKPEDLVFGRSFTDHMFKMYYTQEKGWHGSEIVPYSPISMDPATTVLHYGQAIFEGAKAYHGLNDSIRLFRIRNNFERMNRSAARMCIPEFDVDEVMNGLFELLKIEKDWIPDKEGTALYIRPTIIATDPVLGVHASHTYLFYIILSPVGAYYKSGLKPTKIMVEDEYVRAALGGTGEAKCSANYAVSLKAGEIANQKGYDQVLWLDAKERKYIEEVGAMNMFFVIDGVVVTPKLVGSILPGITRRSAIELLQKHGYKVEERRISIDEVFDAIKNNKLNECFGTGTAAVISPVGTLSYQGKDYIINGEKMGDISKFLYTTLTGIQYGTVEDEMGWTTIIK